MVFRAPTIRLVALAVLAGGAVAGARAQVAAKSPFMPPAGAAPAAAAASDAPIEFRGLMDMGGGLQFRLYDPARKTGSWVKLNERNAELEVLAKKHDPTGETLTVEYKGRTLTLAMRKPKVVSAGTAAQMLPPPPSASASPPAPAANVMPAVTQSVVLNPTPADEQRRLEAVAAEVARRRALREQATQQLNQGAPPAPAMTPPGYRPGMPPPAQPR